MYLHNITLALLCSLLSLSATNAEIRPSDNNLMLRQDAAPGASVTSGSAASAATDVNSEGGSDASIPIGGAITDGSGGGNGAADADAVGAGATSSTSVAAGARATGDARFWMAGVGVGLAGVVVMV